MENTLKPHSKSDLSIFDPLCLNSLPKALLATCQGSVEKALEQDFGAKQVLVFPNPLAAYHHALRHSLPKGCVCFIDHFTPHSTSNLMTQHGLRVVRFEHTHLTDLKAQLSKSCFKSLPKVIFTPSLFLSTGKMAPLKAIRDLAYTYNAHVWVDDSATLGLAGTHFMGASSQVFGLDLTLSSLPGSLSFLCLHKTTSLTSPSTKPLPEEVLTHFHAHLSLLPNMHRERTHLAHLTETLYHLFASHKWHVSHSLYPAMALINPPKLEKLRLLLENEGFRIPEPITLGHNTTYLPLYLHNTLTLEAVHHLFATCNKVLTH